MGMVNCPRCGKLFNQVTKQNVCSGCMQEEERNFCDVRDYIEENRTATVAEVVQETGVSAKRIQKFLREGRLQATPGMGGVLNCTSCGIDILSGKMCVTCQKKLGSSVDETLGLNKVEKKKSYQGAKMHIRG